MVTDVGAQRVKDIGSGVAPVDRDAAAATASNPPAGGTGADAGGHSSAANRNLMIASLAACITDLGVLRTQLQGIGLVAGGSTTAIGRGAARDIGSGVAPRHPFSVTATALAPPAGGSGAQAGCYDTAGNRNLFITSLTALIADIASMRVQLRAAGLVSTGISASGKARMRDLGTGRTPTLAVAIAATASAPPAGGTGQTAGGYDTDTNRDLALASLTAARVDIAALRAELVEVGIVAA